MNRAPNLLFVLADQFRAMCLEPGGDPVDTPSLDRLANDGAFLTNAVSSYPVCSPHRAMLMTGQHPQTNSVTHNVNSDTAARGVGLKPHAPSWSRVLREAGYRTGYIGKWHLEAPTEEDALHGKGPLEDGRVWDAYSPVDRRHGFDFWYSYGCCDDHLTPHYWTGDAPRDQRIDVEGWSAAHETDIAIDFLTSANSETPFALVVSFNPPHQPFDQLPPGCTDYSGVSPRELLNRPNVGKAAAAEAAEIAAMYFSSVTAIDEQVGRLLATLENLDQAADTIVVFTSDHGQQMGSHGLLYKNVPYEESMRLPCVIRWPGRIPQAHQPALFGSADIAPTLLGLVGLKDQIPDTMQGRNIASVLLGASPPDEDAAAIYYRYPAHGEDDDVRGLRTTSWKFIAHAKPGGKLELEGFDLAADPFELAAVRDDDLLRPWALRTLDELEKLDDSWSGFEELRRFAHA